MEKFAKDSVFVVVRQNEREAWPRVVRFAAEETEATDYLDNLPHREAKKCEIFEYRLVKKKP